MSVKKKETVLMVHNYYQIPGGEDTVVANEKKMLEDHGHKVVLYTRHNNELKNLSIFGKFLLMFRTIFNWRTYMDIRRIIREENIDIVHVHNTLPLISPAVYYAAISMKKPVIQTVHNFRLLCPAATFYRDGHICEDCVEKGLWNAVRYSCYRDSRLQTAIVATNMCVHRFLGVFEKIRYIVLTEFNKKKMLKGTDIPAENFFIKANALQCGKIEESQKREQCIFVGRLETIKGIEVLLKAWSLLGRCAPKLIICGTGPLETWCRDYISENKLDKILLKGQISHAKVMEYINQSMCLILPTRVYEGFPVTIIEAFASGVPVICSNIGNAGNLIIHGKTGYKFEYDSSENLAECVVKMLDTYEFLGDNAREKYEEQYTIAQNYDRLREIYKLI